MRWNHDGTGGRHPGRRYSWHGDAWWGNYAGGSTCRNHGMSMESYSLMKIFTLSPHGHGLSNLVQQGDDLVPSLLQTCRYALNLGVPIVDIPFQPLVEAAQVRYYLTLLLETSKLSLAVVLCNVSNQSVHIIGQVLTRKRSKISLNVDGSCTTVCRSQSVNDMKHRDLKYSPDREQLAQIAAAEEGRSVRAAAPELEKVEPLPRLQADTSLVPSHLGPSCQWAQI